MINILSSLPYPSLSPCTFANEEDAMFMPGFHVNVKCVQLRLLRFNKHQIHENDERTDILRGL
jgi:hypothetical protein